MLDADLFTGILQCVFYDPSGRKEHIDTVRLQRDGERFFGDFAAELPGGFDSYQSHTAEIQGKYNSATKQLELEYTYDEESFDKLVFEIRQDKIFGNYPGLDDNWQEWKRELVKDVFF